MSTYKRCERRKRILNCSKCKTSKKITKKKSKICEMTNANINHEILGKIGTYCEISVDLVRSQ